jgi:hypothetical protein
MNRRIAIRSGLLAGLGTAAMAAPSEAAAAPLEMAGQDSDPRVAAALQEIESTLRRDAENRNAHWRVVRQVQEQQRTFLKASHRYPEFVEVGPRAWESLIEWHVREQQTLNVTRVADGRYVMSFMFSNVVLRPDLDDNYVSFGFDNERAR